MPVVSLKISGGEKSEGKKKIVVNHGRDDSATVTNRISWDCTLPCIL